MKLEINLCNTPEILHKTEENFFSRLTAKTVPNDVDGEDDELYLEIRQARYIDDFHRNGELQPVVKIKLDKEDVLFLMNFFKSYLNKL